MRKHHKRQLRVRRASIFAIHTNISNVTPDGVQFEGRWAFSIELAWTLGENRIKKEEFSKETH